MTFSHVLSVYYCNHAKYLLT